MHLIYKYLKFIWHNSARLNNKILAELVEPKLEAKILDIGVYKAEMIIDRVKNIKNPDIYATDIDKKIIKSCRKLGIKAIKHDAETKLPFKSNFFDLVSANQIIEHLLNIDMFTEEIHRVLKPKGYLLISTENLSSWHNLFALLLGWQAFSQHLSFKKNIGNPLRLGSLENFDHAGMHVKIFTLKGLKELLELYKFKVEFLFGAGYYPFPPPLSNYLAKFDPRHSAFIGIKARKIK
ncbi:class I SAM-dependent methyltransferase [Candidatus Daviesbacteria bacterium]|nr:class I SAM-dependent methyltransferase [Candidatus Daviesbacteria bacterium]